ncbi:MAG: hypothetical protein M1837_003119 [Sclerophora amabilis]|nr:MAG: hypothetical protein M1837_003119 [Sclerophora amabilis]
MDSGDHKTPDLASVLRTLARCAPQAPVQQLHAPPQVPQQSEGAAPEAYPADELEEGEYVPSEPLHLNENNQRRAALALTQKLDAASNEGKKGPPTDPATITDWSSGLRCVMRTVSRSEEIMARIRKMISVQHEHERQWWEGRQELIEKQKARVEGRKKLDEVLRSVGGKVPEPSSVATSEEDARELILYDAKVYKASVEMVQAMNVKLNGLGVPFFGTKSQLIRKRKTALEVESCGDVALAGTVDEEELVNLQRKMVELLEDMCKE